jgi:TRAP-type mannitol/chloroaromatic compound transport system substrate-binding protein
MAIRTVALTLVLLIVGLMLVACGSDPTPTSAPSATATPTTAPEPIKVKLLSGWQPTLGFANLTEAAVFDTIRKNTGGLVDIERVAGPESVPTFQQFVPVRDGLFDMVSTTISYHPEFTNIGSIHNYYPADENPYPDRLACGTENLLSGVYDSHGIKYLGMAHLYIGVRTFLNEEPDDIMNLSKYRIRSGGAASEVLMKQLGAATVQVPFGDIYQALERGLVDGMATGGGASVAQALSWDEVTNYHVTPAQGETLLIFLMNMDTWNSIPADLQKIVLDSFIDINEVIKQPLIDLDQDALKAMEAEGTLKEIALSAAESEQWDSISRNAGLELLIDELPADLAADVREIDSCLIAKR